MAMIEANRIYQKDIVHGQVKLHEKHSIFFKENGKADNTQNHAVTIYLTLLIRRKIIPSNQKKDCFFKKSDYFVNKHQFTNVN